MDNHEKIAYKIKLKAFCKELIERRIEVDKQAIENAREITNQEEKSSVGDKYETARAMGQLEQDMFARQLALNIKELSALQSIDVSNVHQEIMAGSFVQCEGAAFFIAAGLGKQTFGNEKILFLSPNAPLAKALLRKKAGDGFSLDAKRTAIIEVF
ncbi:MAG: hypothetical protein JST47_06865 [Bacteroidetes bacterium]|nr:hypothetical protein [Bacteroidota bacterium]